MTVSTRLPDALAPVGPDTALSAATGGRIQSLDILRGLALLGMFIVHFHVRSTEAGRIDELVRTLIWRLVETKSHGTFALLFGAGFAIQLGRAQARNRPFVAVYVRRLVVLALFGVAAHAFFGFNVLLGYAVWGAALLFIRGWSTRALLVTAAVSALSLPLYHLAFARYVETVAGREAVEAASEARRLAAASVNAARDAAELQESYATLLAARLAHMWWFYRQPFSFMPGATLTLFIAGLLLVRNGVFEEPRRHARLLGVLAGFGVISWLAGNWLLERWHAALLSPFLRDQWLTFAYVSVALLLLGNWPRLIDGLAWVGYTGRMALTNYLLQIAALDLLFSGYACDIGHVRPVTGLALALACFAVEVLFSTAWLARFQFGPAEWVWRALSYGVRPPLRRRHQDVSF